MYSIEIGEIVLGMLILFGAWQLAGIITKFVNGNLDGKSDPIAPASIRQMDYPSENHHPAIWDLVIEDMKARDKFGRGKYKTPLQPFNGRDADADLYQELLDACAYSRQKLYERDGK